MKAWPAILSALFFIALLGFLFVTGTQSYYRQLQAHERYRPVDAIIVSSKLNAPFGPNANAVAEIKYNYTVGDKSYQSKRYAYVSHAEDPSARLERYPVGQDVTAWYDPDDPGEAVLNNDETPIPLILSWFIPAPVVALIVWLVYRRVARRVQIANKNGAA